MTKNERLTVLTEAEKFALYGLPDFDNDHDLILKLVFNSLKTLNITSKNSTKSYEKASTS